MTRAGGRAAFAILALGARLALAADGAPVVLKGPWLGANKYTIHFAGTLSGAIGAIRRDTGRDVGISLKPGEVDKTALRVTLDFDQATLDTILLSLCRQAGLVYQQLSGCPYVELRTGDPSVDGSPVAQAGDYTLRVTRVTTEAVRAYAMEWGAALPSVTHQEQTLTLGLWIMPRTAEADRGLAGVEHKLVVTTDQGATFVCGPPEGAPEPDFSRVQRWDDTTHGPGPAAYEEALRLPGLPAAVRRLARVAGALRVYSQARTTEVVIKPVAEGATGAQDDTAATLKSWRRNGEDYQALIELHCPPLVTAPPEPVLGFGWGTRFTILLVGRDGRRWGSSACTNDCRGMPATQALPVEFNARCTPNPFSGQGRPEAVMAAPFEPDRILVTMARYAPADESVPFVLEDVPLP